MVYSAKFSPRKTKNLLLDNFSTRDTQKWFIIANSYDVSRYLCGIYTKNLEEAYENVKCYQQENGKGDYYIAIKTWNENNKGTLIGAIIATQPINNSEHEILEVAMIMDINYRNNGYMTEAINKFIEIVKEQNYNELLFVVQADNLSSKKVIKKIRAQHIDTIKKDDIIPIIQVYSLKL